MHTSQLAAGVSRLARITSFAAFAQLVIFANIPATSLSAEPSRVVSALQPFVEKNTLAGAVTLVANRDKILAVDTVGFADVAAKKSMRLDSLFWIASMSKPITGAAMMLLVDEKKVNLDDPVEKFLPEFKNLWVAVEQDQDHILLRKPNHPITIREILSHTSGLPFKSGVEEPTLDNLPLHSAARSYAITPLVAQPGTKYLYSNAGINTAGRIIEVVSGMPFEDFLQTRLFAPLDMKDTTFFPSEAQVSRLAKAYKPNGTNDGLVETKISQLTYPLTSKPRYPMPGGGLFSTAADLANFCRMVLQDGKWNGQQILSADAVRQMTKKQTGDAVKDGYGIGWSTSGETFGHGGALATNMTIDARRNLITIFLVQHAGFPGEGGKSGGVFRQVAEQEFGAIPSGNK